MSLSASTIWEVRTTGSDTLNGGAFDPSQTAGMLTDGAATAATGSSPVFTSASYAFAAGDVGAWVYIASGTNWTPGWYQIASVSANAATLSAAVGAAVLSSNKAPSGLNTSAGCATTASPTGATWTIDYSQQAAAQIAYTDLASSGAGLTVSSAANPFGKQLVGNGLVVTGGTNFTAGYYVVASVSGTTATVVGAANITTGAGASGTGGLGGAFASVVKSWSLSTVTGMVTFIKSGTYTQTGSATVGANGVGLIGYNSVRGDKPTGSSRPLIQAGANGITLLYTASQYGHRIECLQLSGNGFTGVGGLSGTNSRILVRLVSVTSVATGFAIIGATHILCDAQSCSSYGFNLSGGFCLGCIANNCTTAGFTGTFYAVFCTASGGTNPFLSNNVMVLSNCVAYGGSGTGIYCGAPAQVTNSISYGNGGYGIQFSGAALPGPGGIATLCACGSNTSGNTNVAAGSFCFVENIITLTANPFTNAAAGDFSLNTTAGGGALCRAAGFPGVFPGGLTTGYLDIGAAQHQDSGGGAANYVINSIQTIYQTED